MLKKSIPLVMILSIVMVLVSSWAKITHQAWGDNSLTIALVLYVTSIVAGLYEVWQSNRIDNTEKIMWTVAFVFISTIGFITYLIWGRKRVIGTKLEARDKYNLTN